MKETVFKVIKCAKSLKRQYDINHVAAYSAEAAFFMLVSAVPLVMFAIVLLGALAPFDVIGVGDMAAQLFVGQANSFVAGVFEEIAAHSTVPLASVTMLFLIWAATRGIRSIAVGINTIYAYKSEYNIVQLGFRSVVYTLIMAVVFAASLVILVFTAPLERAATNLLGKSGRYLLTVINMRNIIFFFALTLLFALAYKALAKSSLKFKDHLFGAMVAAAGWILYSFGYSIYIRYFSKYSALYGSFGAVMLFMLWLYMCMNILLCGALLNKLKANGWKM